MMAYSVNRGIAPLIPNISTYWRCMVSVILPVICHRKRTLVLIKEKSVCAPYTPKPTWPFWIRKIHFVPARIRTLGRPTLSPISIPATEYRFPLIISTISTNLFLMPSSATSRHWESNAETKAIRGWISAILEIVLKCHISKTTL
jgi:hypothetical protein